MQRGAFRHLMRDYFSFTRSERNGMVILGILLLISLLLNFFVDLIDFKRPADPSEFKEFLKSLEVGETAVSSPGQTLFAFDPNTISGARLDSLAIPVRIKKNLINYRSKGGFFKTPSEFGKLYGMNDSLLDAILPYISLSAGRGGGESPGKPAREKERFLFDPNAVSEEELEKLGFSLYQRRNLLNYRSKGGKFREGDDLMKVYGVDSSFYHEIAALIRIPVEDGHLTGDSPARILELNTADSLALISLPGIGPAFAGRIVRYRRSLGGFYASEQLSEVYGMTEERVRMLEKLVYADTSLVNPLRLNFADIPTLARHPYFTREQAQQIVNSRSARGPFEKSEDLLERQILDPVAFKKVRPYLTCR